MALLYLASYPNYTAEDVKFARLQVQHQRMQDSRLIINKDLNQNN